MKFEGMINTIQLANSYKLIKQIPDKSIDCIYIDIPYLYSGGYHKHRKINYCFKEEELEDNIEHFIVIDRQADWNMANGINVGKVISETVGQGTILKNGLRIFEGDIYHHGDPNITYTVVWQDNSLKGKQNGSSSYTGLEYWEDRIQKKGTVFDKKEV